MGQIALSISSSLVYGADVPLYGNNSYRLYQAKRLLNFNHLVLMIDQLFLALKLPPSLMLYTVETQAGGPCASTELVLTTLLSMANNIICER